AAQRIGRRRFLKAVPATVAAGAALPSLVSTPVAAQRGSGGTPPRIGKDALKGAEQIAGLHFTDAEEEAALGGVSRHLHAYEELRKVAVPLDTEPAITFRPYLPGKQPAGRTTRGAKLSIGKSARVQVSSNLEELAFEPVTTLASLIESRKVLSTDLTRMYLAR